MEKVGRAPAVAHFSGTVHVRTCWHFEFDLLEVVSEKRPSDLGVGADGIFAVDGLKIADGGIDGIEVFGDIAWRCRDLIHGTGKDSGDRG